ncbi:hypothetical protein EJ04DRAFT_462704 [Polyplosphaeria fusca]|uniref:Uncharacterized protein n=1 Tax=Polyplosphaeria fusca TaxID=682080 RepID=A0A9P4R4H1_9PLEO|nr:hypothetical protein EJ04DRAFT_462704 [Polyplosphaeria fusca]
MAEAVAPGSQDQQAPTSHPFSHGKKRAAETELEGEQRLSKRFDLLDLNKNGARLYVPVPGFSQPATASSASPLKPARRTTRPNAPHTAAADGMQVDDTPNRVYIYDLDAELSDIESDEDNPIFLSDIEKHLSKIPKHLLSGPELKATKDNAMVLYQVPSSLTMPREQDSVRKAIAEARARIRKRQLSTVGEEPGASANMAEVPHNGLGHADDPDAMELD